MKNYVILISGRGSNLQALLAAQLPGACCAVISNNTAAPGLAVAAAANVPTVVIDHRTFPSREAFDVALGDAIEAATGGHADLVLLAGFMRVLTDAFVCRFAGRLVNIHPSLLPAFPGLHTHATALKAGVRVHGCTVHFVTPAVDGGPIVSQAVVPVLPGDDAEILASRVLAQEHLIYPRAAHAILADRCRLLAGRVIWDGDNTSASGALRIPADA